MSNDFSKECAANVMDTIHLVMRTIGNELEKRGPIMPKSLSIQQFRAMLSIKMNDAPSLSKIAEHMGATISSASKLVDSLVERNLVERETDCEDRRKVVLKLTNDGEQILEQGRKEHLSVAQKKLNGLSQSECAMLNLAMELLRKSFIASASDK